MNTIADQLATVLAKGFLKSRYRTRRQLNDEAPKTGLAFPAEQSVHVSAACAAEKGKNHAPRRFEGN
jgi:hypothetical protein